MADIKSRTSIPSIRERFNNINWALLIIVTILSCVGFTVLYSAASGHFKPWAYAQIIRFIIGFFIMILVAISDMRLWYKYSYFLYGISLILLIAVALMGHVGMGARRWLYIGSFRLQPSEIMKIAIILILARVYAKTKIEQTRKFYHQLLVIVYITLPTILVATQPDLGTGTFIFGVGFFMLWLAGVQVWRFILAGVIGITSMPIMWMFILKGYQKNRILNFLNPERDPQNTGYHITQSKIALGSGGLSGKGFMHGTQAQLNFLPEKHTDFIFTLLGEEFGFIGCLAIISLYFIIILFALFIAIRSQNKFGRLLGGGIACSIFLYVFINTGMVMGVIPVVGIPLPLVSYGGTAMFTTLICIGLLLNVYNFRHVDDVKINNTSN